MISKRIAGRKDGRSSAADALRYGEGLTPDKETGEQLDKSHRTRLSGFGLVDDGVYAGRQDMAELIATAAIEMQATLDINTRVGKDKKLAHFVVSFNQYKPSEAVLRDTEDSLLAALKLDKNHFATFLHNDNGYWHLHIFAGRIEKEKPHRGNPLWHDQIIRDKVCREVEIRHGLDRDHGLHKVDETGSIVEVPREERQKRREQKTGITDRAITKEIYSGEKSFQTWATEIRIGDRLKHAKSWQDLHAAAAAYNCEIKPKGAGFVICPLNEKGAIQLSKVGLKNLPSKFGAFEAANPEHQAQPENSYKPSPANEKGASHYAKWQAAKKEFQPAKTEQINSLREAHIAARKELKDRQLAEIKKIRETTKGAAKYAAVSVAKMQHAIDQAAITDRFAQERHAVFKKIAEQGPGNTYRDYLVKEAGDGDNVALGLARREAEKEATAVSLKTEADKFQIRAAVSGKGFRPAERMRFTHQIERTGTVVYNLGNGRVVTDSATAKQIQLNAVAANDPAAIATSLRFASAKYGGILCLTGSAEFRKLAVETAVRERLGVKFSDTTLEAYRERLVAEQQHRPIFTKEKLHEPRHRIQHLRQVPPAHVRERLHNMSSIDLVLDVDRDVSSLWPDVQDRVDQQQEKHDHDLQRPARRLGRAGTAGANTPAVQTGITRASCQPAGSGRFTDNTGLAPSNIERRASSGQRIDVPLASPQLTHPAPEAQALLPLTAADWAKEKHKRLVAPYRQASSTEFTVLYVAADGAIVSHGRGNVAVYSIPAGARLHAGQKIVITKDGLIALPLERGQEAGKGGRGQ